MSRSQPRGSSSPAGSEIGLSDVEETTPKEKKKRGRPKLNPDAGSSRQSSGAAKGPAKRGRPKKSAATVTTIALPQRKRGRPRKDQATNERSTSPSEPDEPSSNKRRRIEAACDSADLDAASPWADQGSADIPSGNSSEELSGDDRGFEGTRRKSPKGKRRKSPKRRTPSSDDEMPDAGNDEAIAQRVRAILSPEELKYFLPPQHASIIASGKWEVAKEEPEYRILPLEDKYLPSNGYPDDWTDQDEELIISSWTREDERALQEMHNAELTVWRKSMRNYGIPATEIMQHPLVVSTQGLTPLTVALYKRYPKRKTLLEPINWGGGFSALFTKLICCDAFSSNLQFLRFILQAALYFRLGGSKFPKPNEAALACGGIDWLDEMNEDAEAQGLEKVPARFRDLMNRFCEGKCLQAMNPHSDLYYDLKRQVKRGEKGDKLGLCNKDISNIIDAWDHGYLKRKTHTGALFTIDEYHAKYGETHGLSHRGKPSRAQQMSRREEVWKWKRDWIFKLRRKPHADDIVRELCGGTAAPSSMRRLRDLIADPTKEGMASEPAQEEIHTKDADEPAREASAEDLGSEDEPDREQAPAPNSSQPSQEDVLADLYDDMPHQMSSPFAPTPHSQESSSSIEFLETPRPPKASPPLSSASLRAGRDKQ